MALSDLLEREPNPVSAQLSPRCRNCQHFADSPYYKIDGKATVCSHERIGRRPQDIPCPHFAVNMAVFRRMAPASIALLLQLLVQLELDDRPGKTKRRQAADIESLTELALALHALIGARKAGFELGGEYQIAGQEVQGTLVSLSKTHGTVKTAGGVPYTVTRDALARAQQP